MHMFSTTTAKEVVELGQKSWYVEKESAWGRRLGTAGS
jgi:hypothetical protein